MGRWQGGVLLHALVQAGGGGPDPVGLLHTGAQAAGGGDSLSTQSRRSHPKTLNLSVLWLLENMPVLS